MAKSTIKDAGKPAPAAKPAKRVGSGKPGILRSFKRYLLESWSELTKVNWPTWREVSRFTGVVLITVVTVAVLIWILDELFAMMSKYAFNL